MTVKITVPKTDLNKLINEIEENTKRLVEDMTNEGAETCQYYFDEAYYAGDNDVKVRAETNDKHSGSIIAEGTSLTFIEYGSGIFFENDYATENGYTMGSWGDGKGANPKGWFYEGEQGTLGEMPNSDRLRAKGNIWWTDGNPPAMAIYNTVKELKENFDRYVREAWK